LYKRYVTLHGLAAVAAFSVAAAWTIMSATQHDKAQTKCIADFFSADSSMASEGETICNIFPWVDVGIMGALLLILLALHVSVSVYNKCKSNFCLDLSFRCSLVLWQESASRPCTVRKSIRSVATCYDGEYSSSTK